MKIVLLRSNPVSPDSRVEKEAFSLVNAGFKVTIVGLDRTSSYSWKRSSIKIGDKEIPILRIGIKSSFGGGIKNLLPMLKFNNKLYKWLKVHRKEYDCIHACDLDTGYTAFKIYKKFKIPYVYDIFDYYAASHSFPMIIRNMVVSIEKRAIDNSECTIICSEKRREQIANSHPKQIIVIHNSPSKSMFEHFSSSNYVSKKQDGAITRIGYVGILSKSRLLKEIIDVVENRQDLELYIGGFGQLEEYIISKSKESRNIKFYGKISYEDTLKLENEMDILTAIYDPCVENHKFAAPNKFYEAIMLGKPLIMVKNTGFDDIITENNLGVLINFSAEGFESGVDELISKKSSWNFISETGNYLFENFFSWEIMEKKLVNIYLQILEGLNNEE